MSEDSLVLGNRLQTLKLGRYKGRLVNMFENPRLGADTHGVAETIRTMKANSALEFQRTYDVGVMSTVVAVPPLASLVFGIVWVRVYAYNKGIDLQIAVSTAFVVATYIVTAGKTRGSLTLHPSNTVLHCMLTNPRCMYFHTCAHRLLGSEKGPERYDGENSSEIC